MKNKTIIPVAMTSLFCSIAIVGCGSTSIEQATTQNPTTVTIISQTTTSTETKESITNTTPPLSTENNLSEQKDTLNKQDSQSSTKAATTAAVSTEKPSPDKKYTNAHIPPAKDPDEIWGDTEVIEIRTGNGYHVYLPIHPPGRDNFCYGFSGVNNDSIDYFDWNIVSEDPFKADYVVKSHYGEVEWRTIVGIVQDDFFAIDCLADNTFEKETLPIDENTDNYKTHILGEVKTDDFYNFITITSLREEYPGQPYEDSFKQYCDLFWQKICDTVWVE